MAAKKKKKIWQYEEDCCRQEGLIEATAKHGKPPAAQWAHLARRVLGGLREAKAESTPLALHFISMSAQEMLEGRHVNAKLCLLTAMTLAERALLDHQMATFYAVFSQPQDLHTVVAEAVSKLKNMLMSLPEGESMVELGPGVQAQVVKKFIGPAPKPKRKKGEVVMTLKGYMAKQKEKAKKQAKKPNPFEAPDPRWN